MSVQKGNLFGSSHLPAPHLPMTDPPVHLLVVCAPQKVGCSILLVLNCRQNCALAQYSVFVYARNCFLLLTTLTDDKL